jgi:hypothetical protein
MGEVSNREDESRENTSSRRRFRGASDDMVGKNRNGTWETLTDPERPDIPLGKNRSRALSIRTKREGSQMRVAAGAAVPVKSWKHDGGKGPC